MNWDDDKLDWNHVRAFLTTVDQGTLSAAARKLGLTQPTLSRQVDALEQHLDVVLFERVGRSLVITPAGAALVERARGMTEAADSFMLAAKGQATNISGTVKITATDVVSVYFLPGAIARIEQLVPDVRIDIVASDDIQNLQRREADIAIRHARPQEPELIARLILTERAGIYASHSYIERFGMPSLKQGLGGHRFLGFGDPQRFAMYMSSVGIDLQPSNFWHDSASGLVAWEMVKQGIALGGMSDSLGERTPGVVKVLEEAGPIKFPVWLVTHRELHTSAKIRMVFDCLAAYLAKGLISIAP